MEEKEILVGTCGFPASRKKVFEIMDIVEIQSTFYNPLTDRQISNIVKEKPSRVELSIKAWHVITHPHTSPLWRKLREPPKGVIEKYGWLRPTKENLSAFQIVYEQAERLGAKIIVFQTPGSMPVNENLKQDIQRFFNIIVNEVGYKTRIAWEPRGDWLFEKSFLNKLKEREVTIVTDILRTHIWFGSSALVYTRLHGLGGRGEVNYKYKYTNADLETLYRLVQEILKETHKVYVLFNNVYMLQDALSFKELLSKKPLKK